jgi:hypothetical protein
VFFWSLKPPVKTGSFRALVKPDNPFRFSG